MSKNMDASLAPADVCLFNAGYEDAWNAYEPAEPVGAPELADADYRFGWWSGVGDASAWHEGYDAARRGTLVCPYSREGDQECFVDPWLNGYQAAFLGQCCPAAAGRMAS